jgi:hypothetical protein
VCGGRTLAQDSVGLFRDILDLHTGHGAIMALEAPVRNRTVTSKSLVQASQHLVKQGVEDINPAKLRYMI